MHGPTEMACILFIEKLRQNKARCCLANGFFLGAGWNFCTTGAFNHKRKVSMWLNEEMVKLIVNKHWPTRF